MTPPIFNLGDEVETKNGRRFEISQIWKKTDGSFAYSDPIVLWVPASELKLVNKAPLSPMWLTYNYNPNDCEHGTIQVSCPCGRKAEIALPEKSEWKEVSDELKIGDFVEIVGQPCGLERKPIGMTGKVLAITCDGNYELANWIYPASSLRKLTPEEIQQHQAIPIPVQTYEMVEERLKWLQEQIDNLREDINGDHVICHQDAHHRIEERLSTIEKRLAFVEKFQRDQDDLIGRAMRDGVVEILDFRRKA